MIIVFSGWNLTTNSKFVSHIPILRLFRKEDEEILIKRLIAYGETALYDSCKTKLGCEGYIYASFLMAYNYHYKPAYKNFAESLLSFYNEKHLYVDEKTSQIIEYCMEKGK